MYEMLRPAEVIIRERGFVAYLLHGVEIGV